MSTSEVILEKQETHKKTKKRCVICRKNLKNMVFTCECKQLFCVAHQSPHAHACPLQEKKVKEFRNKLSHNNPPVIPTKLQAI